jgi:hypothetical protein
MIRAFLRRLLPEPTAAERLADDFAVTPDEAQRALDRAGDERRATLVLLYAATNARSVEGALEDLFSVPGFDGVTAWGDTVEGRRVLLSWRLAQQLAPRRWWLDAWVAIDGRMRRAWLESAERGARRAAERAS